MKNYTITVNGTAYNVTVQEGANASAPVSAPAPAAAPAPAPAAAPAPAPAAGKCYQTKPYQSCSRRRSKYGCFSPFCRFALARWFRQNTASPYSTTQKEHFAFQRCLCLCK